MQRPTLLTDEDSGLTLGVATQLAGLAEKSFDRQVDLDESVWRSLPFFGAALALGVTILTKVADGLPSPTANLIDLVANALFWLSVGSFAWTLRWFWELLRPRDYEYPADDADVRSYAEHVTAFYASGGQGGEQLDDRVLLDLRLFLATHLGDAARANLKQNVTKLKARSQLLLFVLLGFALVILAESVTYISNLGRSGNGQVSAERRESIGRPGCQDRSIRSSEPAEVACNSRGGGVHKSQLRD